ncbi:carboxypeptidase regulatory-like domain-containing protein [Nocardioides sp. 1609]|uniref:carboxypeptidase regulatory-like domain-containing protein n=1 Tax=Nocardioides sp. 1609 TaxID=2508327 RepID=UPI001070424C|nr:carboxypeptidase regulatory-like domain-containing protein [Nocardioides sp. 1609]
MTRLGKTLVATCAIALLAVGLPLLTSGAAHAVTDRWASWSPITGTSNDYATVVRQRAAGFPAAVVATDSRANVQLPSGASTFLGVGTPPGQKYGSSVGSPYLALRPKADNATAPSTTTYTFDRPTPETGWAFVLGDVDADQVRVTALDAAGDPVPAAEVDSWFKGGFNSVGDADQPTWNGGTSTLVGNPTAADTDGATGWFEPDVRLRSLTLVFTRRAGFPIYQTWFVSRARPIGGAVNVASGTCAVEETVLTLVSPWGDTLATVRPDAAGDYDLGEFATQSGYTVRVTAPPGCAVVGSAAAGVDNRGDDGDAAARAAFTVREVIPQPISGTVTDDEGTPLPGVSVTLARPDSSTVTQTTGPDGSYLFDDNPVADGYSVAVTVPDGYAPGPDGTVIGGLDVDATPITGQDFTVRALPDVSGRVTGGGGGLGGVPVRLTPTGGGPVVSTVTDGDGGYTFPRVDADTYTISIDPPEGYTGTTSRDTVVGAVDVTGQDFALARPGAASGEVSDEDGPVADVTVTLDGPGAPVAVDTDAAGGYFLDDLDAGAYTATVTAPDGYDVLGAGTLPFTITAAGEIRGGLDFSLQAAAVEPTPTPTPSPTTTASPTASPTTSP